MSEERKKILEMLAAQKITADEADKLLDALGKTESVSDEPLAGGTVKKNPKFLHVKVSGTGGGDRKHENVDIKIPLMLLKAGMKLGSLVPDKAKSKFTHTVAGHGMNFDLNNLDSKNLDVFIQALTEGSIDIEDDNETVRIYCE